MNDKGEIEFFEFVPVHFVNELESDINKLLTNNKLLLDASKKNMFIFKNFVLRNIIHFPSSFTYERKKTDLVVDSNININKYYTNLSIRDKLINKIQNISKEIHNIKNRNNNIKKILEYEEDMKEATSNIESIKRQYNKIVEYVSSLPFIEVDEDNFNYLLEYREIRSEILRKEWESITEKYDINLLNK
ncbi:uncharacterized protein VNE69_12129 [Vairimorpha necatrix]|uniref:Uncharacterized protein n=1 Tax=Vairimorpha necatrix TaxID=6039 RepID=A0AAX4JGR5_9MICR